MMSMMCRHAMPLLAAFAGLAGACVAISGAEAGVLYRCEGPNGSLAYTNNAAAFTKCTEISRYADEPVKKAPSHVAAPKIKASGDGAVAKSESADTAPVAAKGWTYRENVAEKADVKATDFGVTSTAMPLRASIFGVESTAPLVKPASAPAVASMIASAAPAMLPPSKPAPKVLRGAVYRVQRANGITEYTNVKPASGSAFAVLFTYIATCVACDIHSKIDFARTALNLAAFKDEIEAAAASTGVDVALLRAVIHAESAFNPMAVSNKGAQGLMQLMPGTAGDLGVSDAFDVAQNIGGGAKYLAQLLKDFNGNTQLATAAYNAGEAAVQKYGGVPPYDETQVYVQRVEQLRDRYKKAL
jgi:soluble lytic murein transglycosylase-like protein